MAEHSASARYLAEFIGTFLLVFSVGCNVITGSATWAATSIACTLMVSIYALGPISGANFNPAVSVALGLSGKLPAREVGVYIGMQLLGAWTAAVCYTVMLGKVIDIAPAKGFAWWQAGLAEMLYTFMLCFVVLNVAASKKHGGKDQFYGLAIGFVIIAGGYGAGHISGGAFNPAVAFGVDATGSGAGWCTIYTIYELFGACLAAWLFHVCRPDDFTSYPMEDYPIRTKLVSEFLGTYFLVLTVGLNVLGKSPAGAFSIAASLMCMIFALGTCSGAHFNPAVTCAILASGRGKITPHEAWQYMATQFSAGIVASMTYMAMENGQAFPLGPGVGYTWAAAAFAELIFTFVLCFVVLSVATTSAGLSQYFGLAIGACITAGGCAIGAVSGGSLNPAVSLGINSAWATKDGHPYFLRFLLYTGVELAGAGLAAMAFRLTHPSEFQPKQIPY